MDATTDDAEVDDMGQTAMSRVLLVSPDGDTATQVRTALPSQMYEVMVASDGDEGLSSASTTEAGCDLILLDQRLVEADGELLGTLLDRARNHDVPLIVVGPPAPTSLWAPLLHAGASAYLDTPIDGDALAAQAAVFLRVKERQDQLRAQAVIDELTGVYNRRYLDDQLAGRLAEARRYDSPFSVGLIDIDHFKGVNDTHGHQAGDRVLSQTAALVRRQMRKEDLLARYGGEEFAILLPHTDRLGSAILAERVREAVADHVFTLDPDSIRITISMGIASVPIDDVDTAVRLLGLADERLYEAKASGRNQTVFE